MMPLWWKSIVGKELAQGDYLPNCLMPSFSLIAPQLGEMAVDEPLLQANLIVVTQSCDLENNRIEHVALCLIHSLDEYESDNPTFKGSGKWENVRKGRVEGLHLLASPTMSSDNRQALVVDFGHIISLPIAYLENHARSLGDRWRLDSPYLEHFSQAFARFFMRVGLPTGLPPYK